MAMYLRDIKFSTFFPTQIRSKLSNFGVVITILSMVLLDYLTGLDTPKLHVPDEFHVKFLKLINLKKKNSTNLFKDEDFIFTIVYCCNHRMQK